MRTGLVADVLRAAASVRGAAGLGGAVFHSDNRAQYASAEFADVCRELGVTRSGGAVGTSADNAAAESFNATLKRETLQGRKRWNSAGAARVRRGPRPSVGSRATTPEGGTPISVRSARSSTNSGRLFWPPPHWNWCTHLRGKPRHRHRLERRVGDQILFGGRILLAGTRARLVPICQNLRTLPEFPHRLHSLRCPLGATRRRPCPRRGCGEARVDRGGGAASHSGVSTRCVDLRFGSWMSENALVRVERVCAELVAGVSRSRSPP